LGHSAILHRPGFAALTSRFPKAFVRHKSLLSATALIM
jgi:hypothetical protein